MNAPKLTIIVPVYNEEKTIVQVMQKLSEVCPDAEIIYVNDGSSDRSLELMHQHKRAQDRIIDKENGGKGSALREGIQQASGRFVAIQDADLEYDPAEIQQLVQAAEQHSGSVIFGSRFLTKNPNIYKRYLLGNKVLTGFLNILFGGNLTDSYTCYKLFPTEILRTLPLRGNGFEIEAEFCAHLLKRSIPIREIPIHYNPRKIEEGKKIRFQDAIQGLWMMIRIRCGRRKTT